MQNQSAVDAVGRDFSNEISPETFERLSQLITGEVGIQMPAHKIQMLQGRILRRMRALGVASGDAYCNYLFEHPDRDKEKLHFIDAITTNKTDFFREPKHFEILVQTVVPKAHERQAGQPFQVWCAGCSTGEEPYTISMLLAEHARAPLGLTRGFHYSILATDISTRVLEHGRRGVYAAGQIEPIPEALRERYLLRSRSVNPVSFRFRPEIRESICFHRMNLMEAQYPVRAVFDAIFFRNVMIYFNRPTQEAVLNKLLNFLRPSGYLFIGHSESVNGLKIPARTVGVSLLQKLP